MNDPLSSEGLPASQWGICQDGDAMARRFQFIGGPEGGDTAPDDDCVEAGLHFPGSSSPKKSAAFRKQIR